MKKRLSPVLQRKVSNPVEDFHQSTKDEESLLIVGVFVDGYV